MRKLLVFSLGVLFLLGCSGLPWSKNEAEAFTKARAEKRPILVLFTADWCRHCKDLRRYVLEEDRVAKLLKEKFELLMIDGTKDTPERTRLMTRYGVKAFPQLVLIKTNGKRHMITPPESKSADIFLNTLSPYVQ